MGTTFPWPVYDVSTRRPIYVEEQQRICLEVRRRNCGIDGKPVLFYARRNGAPLPTSKPQPKKSETKKDDEFSALAAALKSLGLTAVNAADVRSAVAVVFPNGIAGIDGGQVIRAVFLHLKRRDSGDKVGR